MITWLLDFHTHTELNLRQMGSVLAAALRKAEDSQVETAVLDLGVKHYKKPKVRICGMMTSGLRLFGLIRSSSTGGLWTP